MVLCREFETEVRAHPVSRDWKAHFDDRPIRDKVVGSPVREQVGPMVRQEQC